MSATRVGLALGALSLILGSSLEVVAQEKIEITGTAGGTRVNLNVTNPLAYSARTISVAGTGKVSAAPDVADINIGVVTQAPTAREALNANNEAMEALLALVKERGVEPRDVQTSGLNINPQYTQRPVQPGQVPQQEFQPRIYAYEVSNTVRITARDLSKLGELLDAVVSAGANRMNGISFRIAESEKLIDECRSKAVADAKRRAEQLAAGAGVAVGLPISIVEQGGFNPPPRPMMMERFAAPMAAASMPVESGELELSLTVNITYELVKPE